jgi:hypothetical protein
MPALGVAERRRDKRPTLGTSSPAVRSWTGLAADKGSAWPENVLRCGVDLAPAT